MLHYFPVNPRNKRPLVKAWRTYNGEPIGTYGIALSSEYLVVDVDPRNGGDDSEQTLLLLGLLPETKIVTTASGGRHYYYKKPEDVQVRKKMDEHPGIDFLSEGCYAIGEGSLVKGVEYVSNELPMANIPLSLLDEIRKNKIQESPVELASPTVDIEELRKLLGYLPRTYYVNYDTWTKVGMCLHNATKGSQEGLNLWDNWSQQSSKYNIGQCSQKWATFQLGKQSEVTVGTLLSYAFKAGYMPETETGDSLMPIDRPDRQDVGDALKELVNWVYVSNIKKFYNIKDKRCFDVDTMRLYYKRVLPKGDPISLILQSKALTIVDALTYRPGEKLFFEEDHIVSLNQWIDPCVVRVSGDASIFENHLKWLLEDDWILLRNWMAWVVQNPAQRLTWAVLITGGQGIGKSYLGEVLQQLLGINNVSYPSNEGIHEKYTNWAASKQLVIINELMSTGRRDLMNRLKQLLTEEYIPVREMHTAEYLVKASFNMLICSNYDAPIVLDADDRRFCLLKSYKVRNTVEYYTSLWSWTSENIGVIKNYLCSVDLTGFDSRNAPKTFAKEILIGENNYSSYEELIDEWVFKNNAKIFTLDQISQELQKDAEEFEFLDNRRLANILRRKYQFIRRVRIKGKLERIYVHYQDVYKVRGLTNEHLVDALSKGVVE
jgi:hypothetical protein